MKIAISAGHGYLTGGKRTCPFSDGRQMREHEFNRDVAFALDYRLRQAGHETIWCFDNVGVSDTNIYERPKIANRANADVFISIHANAMGDGTTWTNHNGLVAMTYPNSVLGRKLARCIMPELQKTTGMPINSYQEVAYIELRDTNMPSIICECGFMTNKGDAEKLLTYEYRRQCAEGIFNGIQAYFEQNKDTNGVEVIEVPKGSLNTLKTNRSVTSLAKEYPNFINGMFFDFNKNTLYDLCISNETHLETTIRPDSKPKGSFYIYKDGRCGVVNLRSIDPKDLQMLVQGVNLTDAKPLRQSMDEQGWHLLPTSQISRGAAIGYDYKTDSVKIVIAECDIPTMQNHCKNAGLIDKDGHICAVMMDRSGSFAYVRDNKVIYNSDGRYMRNIIYW